MNEKELPAGWAWARLGDLGEYINGRGFKKSEWADDGLPIIRIQNLTGSGASFNYFAGDLDDRHTVDDGDLLVAWAATLGTHIWRGPKAAVNQHIFKVIPYVEKKFLHYLIDHKVSELVAASHGSGMVHVTRAKFDHLQVALPPLAEQCRIVDVLEGHLSRLDAAADEVGRSAKRSGHVWSAVLNSVAQGALGGVLTAAQSVNVSDVAEVSGGIQKQQKRRPVDNAYPFLRVANVGRGSLDIEDVHKIELFPGELEKYRLSEGDLLVVEGNGSPDQIGRAAMWKGGLGDVVHQNHLIRVRPGPRLHPRYLELIWNAPLVTNQLREVARSTSGLYTLSTSKVKSVRIPVPQLSDQIRLVEAAEQWETHATSAQETLRSAARKGSSLRRAILNRAFTGALVPQNPADEPAAVLLARIQADCAAQPKAKRTRRASTAPRKAKATATPLAKPKPAPAPSPAPAPTHAVQQEFDL
ncbi:restriction endonuclease subunit S [Streptomyces sp. NBC_00893]|uniref:restriction endonuclease subunit S n=1 Tax=Streptomyces sp. NBC_00893 TaxID=2975862 RepID=UPI00225270E9|nr:restriction endonuclease subunit S [Streptomyces sp. NBC_00893]MCX4847921.1 restriction endonuclease subunit S [Streptomyces sp. NBC_00893]